MTWFSWLLLIVCVSLAIRVSQLSERVKKSRELFILLEKQRQSIIDLCHQIEQQDNLIEELNSKLNKKTLVKKSRQQDINPLNLVEFNQDNADDSLLTESDIVEIYNNDAASLLINLIKVSVKPESIANIHKNEPILLTSIGNGNYCILHNKNINYWLLPKPKLKIDRYRYETVKLLFNCSNYDLDRDDFRLEKPAQISLLPNERDWKLEERGALKFINLLYGEIVDTYNSKPKDLADSIVAKVAQPFSSEAQVILKKAVNYSYMVLDGEDDSYWLLPKPQLKIDSSKYQKLLLLFDCDGYQENYATFTLIKPAKVSSIVERIHWQLEERGKIKFA